MSEPEAIKELYDKLMHAPPKRFPVLREKIHAPDVPGVYVIHDPHGAIEHVGETTLIGKRLQGHMRNASSYVYRSLGGNGSQLRGGYQFRYLTVENPRHRMLLQALATGQLCPRHIGDRVPQSK